MKIEKMKIKKKNVRAFTLLESIMTIALISGIIAVAVMAFTVSAGIFSSELASSALKHKTKNSMERMTRELRGALQIISAEPSGVTFWWRDTNFNSTAEADEIVSFSWNGSPGGDLIRTSAGMPFIMMRDVAGLNFSYDSPGNIEVITITLTGAKNNIISTIESSVKLRNL